MIFTDYWKVHVLNFLEVGNTAFFWAKKLMKRWYLLGLFELSMIFQDLGNTVFHAVLVNCSQWSFTKQDLLKSLDVHSQELNPSLKRTIIQEVTDLCKRGPFKLIQFISNKKNVLFRISDGLSRGGVKDKDLTGSLLIGIELGPLSIFQH